MWEFGFSERFCSTLRFITTTTSCSLISGCDWPTIKLHSTFSQSSSCMRLSHLQPHQRRTNRKKHLQLLSCVWLSEPGCITAVRHQWIVTRHISLSVTVAGMFEIADKITRYWKTLWLLMTLLFSKPLFSILVTTTGHIFFVDFIQLKNHIFFFLLFPIFRACCL